MTRDLMEALGIAFKERIAMTTDNPPTPELEQAVERLLIDCQEDFKKRWPVNPPLIYHEFFDRARAIQAEQLEYGEAQRRAGKLEERAERMKVDEKDGGWETWMLSGHIQKNDGSVFTDAEADALIDDFLAWCESKGLGYGGGLGVPTRAEAPAEKEG